MGDDCILNLPEGVSESELFEIVREILGDDMTDGEIRSAYNAPGFFQDICPDIEAYIREYRKKGTSSTVEQKSEPSLSQSQETEKDVRRHDREPGPSHVKERGDDSDGGSHQHHKKKKKKHKKEHRRDKEHSVERRHDDKEKVKIKKEPTESERPKISLHDRKQDSGSDSEDEDVKVFPKEKKEKKKKNIIYFGSSSEEDEKEKEEVKRKEVPKDKAEERVKEEPKDRDEVRVKVEPKDGSERKKEPKPFTKYNGTASKVQNIRRFRPVLHRDHLRYQKKFRLKPVSVTCVDLLDFPLIFRDPKKRSNNPNAIPLKSGIELSESEQLVIRRMEKDKRSWFNKKLTKVVLRSMMKHQKRSLDSSDSSDDDRPVKHKRIPVAASSDSSSSVINYRNQASNAKPKNDFRDKDKKLSKAEREAELKRRKIEEIKRKMENTTSKSSKTRVLPWENKDSYFNAKKKEKAEKEKAEKLKERLIEEKKREKLKRIEKLRKEKSEEERNKVSDSYKKVQALIQAANKAEASKPKVQLKIPKLSDKQPSTEFKIARNISVGDVAKEVARLLSSDVKVEIPVIPENFDDLGEYTVKKIAWWILKNEKEPADEGPFHPELHDNDEDPSDNEDDFDWPDDMSSVHGCVSDPEGLGAEAPHDPAKLRDPDWIDEYCGEASLYAKIRRDPDKTKPLESYECFYKFLKMKPGTNYAKQNNFEVVCFLCKSGDDAGKIKGQRQLGAHIRSEFHKQNFRNFTLDMAKYEEDIRKVTPKKEFIAKLVEYSVNHSQSNAGKVHYADNADDIQHRVGKIGRVRSNSPGPIVAGDAAANIETYMEPIPDDISLPSIEDYDISSDESLENVRVEIRTSNKWNDDLEKRWRAWKDEEAKIAEMYNNTREWYINEPEKHPRYQEEWLKYWDQKCEELENQGEDTENYDFNKDWMPFWLKRMQEIMHEEVEQKVFERKRCLGIDKHTLRQKFGISAETTRRKKLKKKGKNKYAPAPENSSSLRTGEVIHHQSYLNKPSCLPTPPVTNEEGRNRDRYFSENRHRELNRKSPTTPLNAYDSSNSNLININDGNNANANPVSFVGLVENNEKVPNLPVPGSPISSSGDPVPPREEGETVSADEDWEPAPPGEEGNFRRQAAPSLPRPPSRNDRDARERIETVHGNRRESSTDHSDGRRKDSHRRKKHSRDKHDHRREDRHGHGHRRHRDDRYRSDSDGARRGPRGPPHPYQPQPGPHPGYGNNPNHFPLGPRAPMYNPNPNTYQQIPPHGWQNPGWNNPPYQNQNW